MITLIETQAQQIEALRHAVDTLEGRLALRSELDVIVAHELRTPLTVIAGALETLHDMELDDDRVRRLVAMAHEQSDHLSDVVEELLVPQRHGGPVVARAKLVVVDLASIVAKALAAVSVRLGDREVATEVPEGFQMATSPVRLTAIMVNLFENASRYGGDPIECRAGVDARDKVWIEVVDNGPGLRGADPEDLFDAFAQGSDGADEGRGVGLYMVRMLARSMGGEATLTERPEGGCVARVELPQRRAADPRVPAHAHGSRSES
jgi:signal transduction histidine kinase